MREQSGTRHRRHEGRGGHAHLSSLCVWPQGFDPIPTRAMLRVWLPEQRLEHTHSFQHMRPDRQACPLLFQVARDSCLLKVCDLCLPGVREILEADARSRPRRIIVQRARCRSLVGGESSRVISRGCCGRSMPGRSHLNQAQQAPAPCRARAATPQSQHS